MNNKSAVNVFIVCGLFILIGVSGLIFSFGASTNHTVLASAVPDISGPKVESKVVEISTIVYVDRPVIEIRQVEAPSKASANLRNFESLDELKQWLAISGDSTTIFMSVDGKVDCDDYALALQQRALADGYMISFQIIHAADYNQVFTGIKVPPDVLHAVDLAVIGNDVYYIEPQTNEIVFAANLD